MLPTGFMDIRLAHGKRPLDLAKNKFRKPYLKQQAVRYILSFTVRREKERMRNTQ